MTPSDVSLPEMPERITPSFCDSCGQSWPDNFADEMRSYALAAVMAERERAVQACLDERVDAKATGTEGDAAYNRAIEHCIAAIRQGSQSKQEEA